MPVGGGQILKMVLCGQRRVLSCVKTAKSKG
nr:MAG TPA: hypothetical protein [Caudoviricetes sp.]